MGVEQYYCQFCKWWKRFTGTTGACHNRSPLAVRNTRFPMETVGEWPTTSHIDWCGDFAPEEGDSK